MSDKNSFATNNHFELFETLKKSVALIDPVAFAENNLMIDGRPFRMSGTGWKFMTEVYRYVAAQAGSADAKPVVMLKSRQIGATILAAVLSLYFTSSGIYGGDRPPMRILHAFPTLGLMGLYAKDKLDPMIRNSQEGFLLSRSLKNDTNIGTNIPEDTQTEKNFIGFNKLRVDSLGRDADRIRGFSGDGVFFDEVQDMNKTAVENTLPVLTASQYGPPTQGIQLFFGTPKETGSFLWELWENSDKRYYQLKCIGCDHYFFLYKIGEEYWRDLWLHGYDVQCPECECVQDKRAAIDGGRWVPTVEDAKYVGFHMNVILNPMFTKEAVLLKDPNMDPHKSVRAWKNETMGEFYSGSGSPLTAEELLANSLLPERGIVKSIRPHSGRTVTMGIDWGDKGDDDEVKRGKSYTAIAIMSSDADGRFIIENAFRLPRTDWDYKIKVIQELIKRFNVSLCIADYGFGNDIVNHIQRDLKYGKRFIGCISSGSLKTTISYNPKDMRITVNKDLMIDDIFSLFKKGYIQLPAKGDSYDALWWLVENCTSMESKIVDRNGNKYKTYIKGNGPNDGLMALMYAVIGYRFLTTNEFKNRGVGDQKSTHSRPVPIGAYAPALRY